MQGQADYRRQILVWTGIGLALRLMLMPITMTSIDMVFINYFPMMCAKSGICDPYGYIARDFPRIVWTYYGPFLFILMSAVHFIFIKLFNPAGLIKMLELASTMMFVEPFTTRDFIPYMQAYASFGIFKSLFLMKLPYLLVDFAIAGLLLKLSASNKSALGAYKLWMLNIVVLHSQYMVGQCDIFIAFFITLALFAALKNYPYLAVACLVAGGGVKLFPYVLIFPTCLLLGENWKKRLSLMLMALFCFAALYLPFYISSGRAILGTLKDARYYPGIAQWVLLPIAMAAYIFISFNALKDSKEPFPQRKLIFYFLANGLLVYAATPISFRYFVYLTPLLALFLPGRKKLAIFTIFIIIMLAFLRLADRSLQMGLFIPFRLEYFMSLPTIQEILSRFINIKIVYQVMARMLLLSFFAAAWWVWRLKDKTGGLNAQ